MHEKSSSEVQVSKQISFYNKRPLFSHMHLTFVFHTLLFQLEPCKWAKLLDVGLFVSCLPACTMSVFTFQSQTLRDMSFFETEAAKKNKMGSSG